MLVGDPSPLAIEWESVVNEPDASLGHFALWVDGVRICDFGAGVALTGVVGGFVDALNGSGLRSDAKLASMKTLDAITFLRDLYRREPFEDAKDALETQRWVEKFYLLDLGQEASVGFDIVLIETPKGQRLLWHETESGRYGDTTLPPRAFENLTWAFVEAFVRHTEREFRLLVGEGGLVEAFFPTPARQSNPRAQTT